MASKNSATASASLEPLYDTQDLSNVLQGRRGAKPSPRTIERWRKDGTGPPFIKVGHRVFYRPSAVARWYDQQERSHTNELRPRARTQTKAR